MRERRWRSFFSILRGEDRFGDVTALHFMNAVRLIWAIECGFCCPDSSMQPFSPTAQCGAELTRIWQEGTLASRKSCDVLKLRDRK